MKSLERRYNNIADNNPLGAPYFCLANAVKGQQFSRGTISHSFTKLIDVNEYGQGEKRQLINHLCTLSNIPRTTKKKALRPKLASKT